MEIWTEKYRPKTLNEVINQKHVVERLKSWVKEKSIPNMLFAGPAGVGKTTTALALAQDLFGKYWKENFSETNASDDRGINVVRGRIKDFARTKPIGADFKIIFLDESDALTPEAQQALRRTMEKFSDVCRFILSANYSSRIIEPIQSRCAVFRFKKLSEEDVTSYLKNIAESEDLDITPDAYKAIYDISSGDLRKATNILQTSAAFGKITRETVYDVVSQAKPEDVKEMLSSVMKGDFASARKKLYSLLIDQGLSGEDIIKEIHRQVFELGVPDKTKLEMIEKIGEYEFRLNQGGSEDIQLEALLAQFLKYSEK
ncbi:MAG: replication factor C small subunit [Candidatus Aenigmatarchaeota archaeon]|nr:MAG: replication factor C small subunit [Candidatus Aenigmarchaeota archaeon]RLJ07147.1 MAG: replication factor C small subunit [Candidatus Aenigmarchaeota archaeon]RLJ08543.1 MAG: replication factor C small subunit [Candidatus Aenigmarchaeota archaeon]